MKKEIHYRIVAKNITEEIIYIPLRYIIAVILTIFEIAAIIGIVIALCFYVKWFYILAFITEIACVLKIVASDYNPDYKVPWLLVVILLPVVGFMLFFMFYSRNPGRKYFKRLEDIDNAYRYSYDDERAFEEMKKEDARAYAQAKMLTGLSSSHLFDSTSQQYFATGEEMFSSMLADVAAAESFVFIEYFIIESGSFWNPILDILKEKAASGVTVRVLYDDIGCMTTLPGNYRKYLARYGIEGMPFSILRGNADGEFNNRSHRKLFIVDGRIGYTGGINIADEYINAKTRFGHWKDTGIRLEGSAVYELTELFMRDWGVNTKHLPQIFDDAYPIFEEKEHDGYMVPFSDGPSPIYKRNIGKTVIQNILYSAREYVYMTSPYLVIDNDLCTDIENTAMRGVDVRIIVPHKPDKYFVFAATRSFYARLIAAGVKIYEYEPGFIHAKSYVADGKYAMIGTINLDYRSLVHHFENGVWMYNTSSIKEIKADIDDIIEKSIEITPKMLKTNIVTRFIRSIVRIFAPML